MGATKALATIPPPFGAILAGVTIATGLMQVAKIAGISINKPEKPSVPKAEQGALFNIGGKRHNQGGTKFYGEDGTTFEAEQGETIGVMNRNAARLFMEFNDRYRSGGTITRPNVFQSGGIIQKQITGTANLNIDYDLLGQKMVEANASLPAPIVFG